MRSLHSSNSVSSIVQLQHSLIFNRDRTEKTNGTRRRTVENLRATHEMKSRMTMAYLTGNRTYTAPLGQRLADVRANAMQAYSNWRVYRNTLAELQDLSMREMADLGINPSMIKRIAMEAAYGKAV
ncbi:DUF1127 domain-containing protein [Gymnodinialimonas sp.]